MLMTMFLHKDTEAVKLPSKPPIHVITNKQMNEWTNEQTNEQRNKWTNEWINEQTNDWTNERRNECLNEETSKQTGKQMKTYGKLFQVDKMSIQSKRRRSRDRDAYPKIAKE